MKVIKKILSLDKYEILNYPRIDMGKIEGLDNDIKFYIIEEDIKPSIDNKLFMINIIEIWDDNPNEIYNNLGTYKKTYKIEKLSNEIIIDNLNASVGEWIDKKYPLWEQNKHTGQILRFQLQKGINFLDDMDISRMNWIIQTADWAKKCRELRDQKEHNLIANNILPDFIWPERPEKPYILK